MKTQTNSDVGHMEEVLEMYDRSLVVGGAQQVMVATKLQLITNSHPLSVLKVMTAFSKLKGSQPTP